jgi:amino acid adenylation domain-containing protein
MEAVLVQKANAAPNATAVVDDDRSVTYRELIARADVLADLLYKRSLKPENPVFILADAGLPQVMAQVAVLRAGGSCVPIDPAMPASRLKGMLEDLDTTHIITGKYHAHRAAHLNAILIEKALEARIDLGIDGDITMRSSRPGSHRSHIMFTSGSTSRPKPIQVLSSCILHALNNSPIKPLHRSDRMTALITPGFDLSLFEIWGALLDGSTIVRVPDLVRADPFLLRDFVHEHEITIMTVPTALFHVISLTAPTTFGGLRHVLVGGEAVSTNSMRKVLETAPPENLWNGYGPAEATIYVTMVRVDQEEVQRPRISIGRAVGDTRIYLLDDNLKPIVEPGHTAEICIAGPQVSPGYLNRPEENKKSFVLIDAATLGAPSEEPIRLYRTGDLAQWRDNDGFLDYIGRADDQVKISGYRVELGGIARCIEEHPQIHSCVVKYEQKGDVDYLEGYVIPVHWDSPFRCDELVGWVKDRLPSYMVPGMVHKKHSFPLSANGKVDRNALHPDDDDGQLCDEKNRSHPLTTNEEKTGTDDGHETADLVDWLTSILQKYLPKLEITPSDNFFSYGLASLQAAQFIGRIRQDRGKSVTLAQLHENPTIERLAKSITGSVDKSTEPSGLERLVQDLKHLDIDLLPLDWQVEGEGRVFLTGTTGFLGAHILYQLLKLPQVRKVACLARGRDDLGASARIQQTLEKYDLWDGRLEITRKIMVLEGDLADNTLGLGEEQFQWLIEWASVIFHVGARVNWCEPYETLYEPNVLGTRNIIRAAILGRRKALHYVSSIDVWTVTGFINKVDRVYEDDPLMPHLNAVPYDTGYSASQFVAEETVQRARARGLATAIYRPGFIIGHSQTAITN